MIEFSSLCISPKPSLCFLLLYTIEFSILVVKCRYYPLMVVQAGRDDVDKKSTRVIKKDFKALVDSLMGQECRQCSAHFLQ